MYSAELGRWHVADPANQFFSPYLAIANDPVNNYDPDGQFVPEDDPWGFPGGGPTPGINKTNAVKTMSRMAAHVVNSHSGANIHDGITGVTGLDAAPASFSGGSSNHAGGTASANNDVLTLTGPEASKFFETLLKLDEINDINWVNNTDGTISWYIKGGAYYGYDEYSNPITDDSGMTGFFFSDWGTVDADENRGEEVGGGCPNAGENEDEFEWENYLGPFSSILGAQTIRKGFKGETVLYTSLASKYLRGRWIAKKRFPTFILKNGNPFFVSWTKDIGAGIGRGLPYLGVVISAGTMTYDIYQGDYWSAFETGMLTGVAFIPGYGWAITIGYTFAKAYMLDVQNRIKNSSDEGRDIIESLETLTEISCFKEGSKVLLGNGSYINIEYLKVGDSVLTYNFTSKTFEKNIILQIDTPIHYKMIKLAFSNGEVIYSTEDHPYFVEEKGWCSVKPELTKKNYGIETKQLELNDHCLTFKKNKLEKVEVIQIVPFEETIKTYNLSKIANSNNYFVNGILVNNEDDLQNKN